MERLRKQLQLLAPQPAASPELFVDFEELLAADGVRLTGIPGIFAVVVEYVRYLLHVRGVDYTMAAPDRTDTARLYEATRQESVPTLFVDGERPYNTWLEQTYKAAALGDGPSLIPASSAERVVMFGLMNEIQGEGGLLFNKRFAMIPPEGACAGSSTTPFLSHPTPVALAGNAFGEKYGWSPEAAAGAEDRIVEILGALDAQLVKQQQSGSRFFIGAALTALDVHWAAFSNMVAPGDASLLPHNNPHSMPLNVFSATNTPRIEAAITPLLLSHREFIYETYLGSGAPFPVE